jgi:hypothetical protein
MSAEKVLWDWMLMMPEIPVDLVCKTHGHPFPCNRAVQGDFAIHSHLHLPSTDLDDFEKAMSTASG